MKTSSSWIEDTQQPIGILWDTQHTLWSIELDNGELHNQWNWANKHSMTKIYQDRATSVEFGDCLIYVI
jgi:hypothetical protein